MQKYDGTYMMEDTFTYMQMSKYANCTCKNMHIYIYANCCIYEYINPRKGVWAPALTPSPNPLPGTGRRGCGLGKD